MNAGFFAQASGRSDGVRDVPWKNEMRWRRAKRGDATGRPSAFAWLLGHPDAKFFSGKWEKGTKNENMEANR